MANGEMGRHFDNLASQVQDAAEKVTANRRAFEARVKAENAKTKWWRRAAVLGLATSIFAVFLVIRANDAAEKANDAIEEIVATRTEARAATCEAANANAARINALNDRTFQLLEDAVAAPRETPRTPEEQAATDAFLEQQRQAFEAIKVELRDCSPEGIEAFYDQDLDGT